MHSSALLLSIRPKYAEKIFDGTKTIELRRVKPRVSSGDIVIVYVSSPAKELKALFVVERVISDKPHRLWNLVGGETGITREEFDSYFDGAELAFAIEIRRVEKLSSPISLSKLRDLIPGFTPPQIYQYYSGEKLNILMEDCGFHLETKVLNG